MNKPADRKFAYVGYDEFCDVIPHFLSENWALSHFFPQGNNCRRLGQIAGAVGAVNMGDYIDSNKVRDILSQNVNLMIVAGYPKRIPLEIISAIRIMNIHPSFLPLGRGMWPQPDIVWSSGLGAGVTFHKMDENFDCGEIVIQKTVEFEESDNIHSLMCKQALAAESLAQRIAKDLDEYWESSTAQGDVKSSLNISAPEAIDWGMVTELIERIVKSRGLFGTSAKIGNTDVLVLDVRVWRELHNRDPGTIVYDWGEGPLIAVPDGYVFVSLFIENGVS